MVAKGPTAHRSARLSPKEHLDTHGSRKGCTLVRPTCRTQESRGPQDRKQRACSRAGRGRSTPTTEAPAASL